MFNKIIIMSTMMATMAFGMAFGHPGPLDEHGCHQCTEGCEQWGRYDGEFHCHRRDLYGSTLSDLKMFTAMLCHAIHHKQLVKVVMKLGGAADQEVNRGSEATREMVLQPYAYGMNAQRQPTFRAYQLTGTKEERKWENYRMENILELRIVDISYEEPKEGAGTEGISEVKCQYGVEAPKQEQQ